MSVQLPEIDKMRDALIKSGVPSVELDKEIDEMVAKKPVFNKNRKLLYKALCDKHKVNLNLQYGQRSAPAEGFTPVSALTQEKKLIRMRGYILNIPEPWEVKNDSLMTVISFADETGHTGIGAFQKNTGDLIDRLLMEFKTFPAPVLFKVVNTGEYKGKLSVSLPVFTDWEKIKPGELGLPQPEEVFNKLDNSKTEFAEGGSYVFYGYLTDVKDGGSYVGCPDCHKKLEVEEGVKVACANAKCAKMVTAVTHPMVSILVGDEYGEVGVSFASFSGVSREAILALKAEDSMPAILVGASYSEQYALSGKWITAANPAPLQVADSTPGIIDLSTLDFKNDKARTPLDEAQTAEVAELYESRLRHFGNMTPDEMSTFVKSAMGVKDGPGMQVEPVIKKLAAKGHIRIVPGGKFKYHNPKS